MAEFGGLASSRRSWLYKQHYEQVTIHETHSSGGGRSMTYLVVRHARACSAVRSPPLVEDVGGRGGRLSLTANLSYEPPSPRDARPAHLGPSPSVHRPTRLTRPLAGAGSQASPPGRRASSERGAGARDLLSCPACRRMHGRSEIFPAVGMAGWREGRSRLGSATAATGTARPLSSG